MRIFWAIIALLTLAAAGAWYARSSPSPKDAGGAESAQVTVPPPAPAAPHEPAPTGALAMAKSAPATDRPLTNAAPAPRSEVPANAPSNAPTEVANPNAAPMPAAANPPRDITPETTPAPAPSPSAKLPSPETDKTNTASPTATPAAPSTAPGAPSALVANDPPKTEPAKPAGPQVDAPKIEPPKVDALKPEPVKVDPPKSDPPKTDLPKSPEAKPAEAPAATPSTAAKAKIVPQDDGSVLVDDKYPMKGKGTKEDPYRITWDHLVSADQTYQPRLGRKVIPDRIKMLDGKFVRINGYIAFPLMASSADEMLMMLNQWDGCCIGQPPTPYDAIEVKLKTPAKGEMRLRTTGTLTGVLRVDPYLVKDWLVSLYVMDDGELSDAAGQVTPGQHAGGGAAPLK